jgi:hypothetical protein
VTLDELVLKLSINSIELIKLEAEGSEPEVLKGALKSLYITKWVVADLGSERGVLQEATYTDANKILVDAGFVLIEKGGLGFRESYKYRNKHIA